MRAPPIPPHCGPDGPFGHTSSSCRPFRTPWPFDPARYASLAQIPLTCPVSRSAEPDCKDRPDTCNVGPPRGTAGAGEVLCLKGRYHSPRRMINVYVREVRSGASLLHVHHVQGANIRPILADPRKRAEPRFTGVHSRTHDDDRGIPTSNNGVIACSRFIATRRASMLLYFPAENAAVPAVVLLCKRGV